MIRRLLIANRGEIAVRIVAACRELGIKAVSVYSDADADALHVRCADEAVRIGPAPSIGSYLNVNAILQAARQARCDAVHPGYGFLSQNPAFASTCERAGITFVGPAAETLALMGSKIASRQRMVQAGVPIVPGETPDDQSDTGISAALDRVGLPALVKASAGGGGKGMRIVREPSEVLEAVASARREALAAFGDGTLYVERLIIQPRHIEVQVFGDDHGRVVHLFERECSAQRRHQKVIEESPAPGLSSALRQGLADAAVRAAAAVAYRNAGTVEFLLESERFYFLEMNTRLQVEHGVTELVAHVDLVRAQLMVAAGDALPWTQDTLAQRGHAIEARVYAEDPASGFLPQAGRLLLYREPKAPGVRVDSGVSEGDSVSVHYDPLLAKVIAWAETRELAIARLSAALRAFPVLGVCTNIRFLLRILAHPRFRDGAISTDFLDRAGPELATPAEDIPQFVRAAMTVHEDRATPAAARARTSWDPWMPRFGAERTKGYE
jgi:3-methylcrotonyl-CoA carboxylase alpha subunit